MREIYGQYKGTYLGFLWVALEPLLMLAVYTFVLKVIFGRHWYSIDESILNFGTILFSGLLVFNFFRETISAAPRLVLRNVNYVKKVVFPLEILPFVSVLAGIYRLIVSFVILVILIFVSDGRLHTEILYTPIVILPYTFFVFGLCLFLSSIGVYLRDVGQIISLLVMATLFLSAIFYPIESVPLRYQNWFYLSPIAFAVDQFRDEMIWGNAPPWKWVAIHYLTGLSVIWLGLFWFQKTRKGFADVL